MKGIADYIGKLILMIIFVIALTAVFFSYLPYFEGIAKQFFPGSNPETTDFDNALKCTYFRCTKGCDSNEVKALTATWVDPQTHNDVSCVDFCKSGQTICNQDSQSNPVRIDIAENAFLAQTNLNSEIGTNCIVTEDFQPIGAFFWGAVETLVQDAFTAQWTFIYSQLTQQKINDLRIVNVLNLSSIDPTSIQLTRVDCYTSTIKFGSNAIASLNLVPGKYQISMVHNDNPIGRLDVLSISQYQKTSTSTAATSCAAQGGTCKPACNTNNEQDLGQLDCQKSVTGNTAYGTCCKPT